MQHTRTHTPSPRQVYLSEILDFSNAALGFSIPGMQAAIGRLLGPSIGGLLSNPAAKFPALAHSSVFATYPYLLPCIISAVVSVAGILIAYRNLPETLNQAPPPSAKPPAGQEAKAVRAPRPVPNAHTTVPCTIDLLCTIQGTV